MPFIAFYFYLRFTFSLNCNVIDLKETVHWSAIMVTQVDIELNQAAGQSLTLTWVRFLSVAEQGLNKWEKTL